jgi:hypothetical protein
MDSEVVALTIDDRERLLCALDDADVRARPASCRGSCRSTSGAGARGSFDVVHRVGRMGRRVTRTIRAVRIAATDARIPRPLRWLAALGLAPIPGPVDEVILVIVAVPLALFYRGPLREAWASAGIDMPPSTP